MGQAVPPDMDLFFDIAEAGRLPVRVGVRREGGIPRVRRGRRTAQGMHGKSLLWRMLQATHGQDVSAAWSLSKTGLGQPCLRGAGVPRVSLTHSGEWLACATSPVGCVGIDIESMKPRDWGALQHMFLHPHEAEWVMAVQGRERDIRAYTCWCRKEAALKALGIGAVVALDGIAFSPEGQLVVAPRVFEDFGAWRTRTVTFDGAVLTVVWSQDAPYRS